MSIRWLTAFLDGPRDDADEQFWTTVTATTLSTRRGDDGEFVTLRPADGDAYLRRQITHDGAPGVHLDLHTDAPSDFVAHALGLGATHIAAAGDVTVLTSPGGFAFCVVEWASEHRRPGPVAGHGARSDGCIMHSRLDQLCLDIPRATFESESRFWSQLTGWPQHSGDLQEFDYLERPDGAPLRLLLQRTEADGLVRGHLDFAANGDADAVVAWHQTLGATWSHHGTGWTTLRDPSGREYCITNRRP